MNLYDVIMSPLEALFLGQVRSEIMASAHGDVLEAGIGTGANSRYYDYSAVRRLIGLDREYSPKLGPKHPETIFTFAHGDIEYVPFEDGRFDCVVATLILCTTDLEKSLAEIKRVLKPGGLFIFIEHVRPEGSLAGALSDRLNRVWPKVANGCNLNRRTGEAIMQNGFIAVRMRQKCGGIFIYGTAATPHGV